MIPFRLIGSWMVILKEYEKFLWQGKNEKKCEIYQNSSLTPIQAVAKETNVLENNRFRI